LQDIARFNAHSTGNVLHGHSLLVGELSKTEGNFIVAQAVNVGLRSPRLQALLNTLPIDFKVWIQLGNLELKVSRYMRPTAKVSQELSAGTKIIHNVADEPRYPNRFIF
jgi:hypothetical protein